MNIQEKVLQLNSFKQFNTVQQQALNAKLFEKSLIVSSPTSSGKTIIAELAALNSIINKKKKVIYTCPLRALASEHFKDLKQKYSKSLKIKMALSTGDFDSSSKYLKNYDLIFATNEKIDSLIRHNAEWLKDVGLLIVDEIHTLDSNRGPTLEMVITKLKALNPELKIIGLSATIPNSMEIAEWLDAELVQSDFRPVELKEGVFLNNKIFFLNEDEKLEDEKNATVSIVLDTIKKQKQALVFANTRRNAENFAKTLSASVYSLLTPKDKKMLERESVQIKNALESPTEQCKKLSSYCENGVAFHHAGLVSKQRNLIEESFRQNKIKVICSTPTLAAGINIPAFRVIIPSLYRYSQYGMQRIKVSEYKQIAGRAGRPKYDSSGESILIAKHESEKDLLVENFILGTPEEVESQLSNESVLRTHLLALISSEFVFDSVSLKDFFSKTFYAKHQNIDSLVKKLLKLVEELEELKFVTIKGKKFFITPVGRRVSDLYLDPFSAKKIIEYLHKKLNSFFTLYMLASANEFFPWVNVPRKDEASVLEELYSFNEKLPFDVDTEQFLDQNFVEKFYSTLMLKDWINEVREQELMNKFGVAPGILRTKLERCDWLSYASIELAKILKLEKQIPEILKIRKRLKSGVKEELLQLVELKGIGRVRARRLYNSGIKTLTDVKKTDVKDLSRAVKSDVVAESVKKQLKQ